MLLDRSGSRKYLTKDERQRFLNVAAKSPPQVQTFCLTLAFTGGRISEVLALTAGRIDMSARAIVIECLKRRHRGIFRSVPVPTALIKKLDLVHELSSRCSSPELKGTRLWPWGRTAAWGRVKHLMNAADIPPERAMPKALRHAFGVAGTQVGIPLHIIQRWLGHARIETTAIYANVIGDEERALADRMWM